MTIEVTIPEGIVNTCKECGYDENKTKKVAQRFLSNVMNDPYDQLVNDFTVWLDDEFTEDFLKELENTQD